MNSAIVGGTESCVKSLGNQVFHGVNSVKNQAGQGGLRAGSTQGVRHGNDRPYIYEQSRKKTDEPIPASVTGRHISKGGIVKGLRASAAGIKLSRQIHVRL